MKMQFRHLAMLGLALFAAAAPVRAQAPADPLAGIDPIVIEDLVAANRILANEKVLDGFGHVSVRDPRNPNRYLIARSVAPAQVTAGDILLADLDSNVIDPKGRTSYKERFIHGEIYKVRPDVMAVIHTHSPTIVPFSVTKVPLKPILHNAAFLGAGPPIFEIREAEGGGMATNLLVETPALGRAIAKTLGQSQIVLMRGHGNTVVGPNVRLATYWAIYAEINARQLATALALGGSIVYLEGAEAEATDKNMRGAYQRPWNLWKAEAMKK
jgi:ribulose-5-phosphate 4-epimerase/fuculose-1-phosphate aldolase